MLIRLDLDDGCAVIAEMPRRDWTRRCPREIDDFQAIEHAGGLRNDSRWRGRRRGRGRGTSLEFAEHLGRMFAEPWRTAEMLDWRCREMSERTGVHEADVEL